MGYYSDMLCVAETHKWKIVVCTVVVGYGVVKLLRRPSNLPPGPWGWPIIGALFEVSEDTIHEDLIRLGNKYGEIFSIRTGRQ